ncbi:plasmid mobilization protein [Streptomyces longwoodensis]|uniref:plasmid mobilization protein n=1 Tax=Streptomyces longwoodensis TaxID=68231 RepID=UPI003F563D06
MTNPTQNSTTPKPAADSSSVSGRARWRFGHSPEGAASEPNPALGVTGPDWHQGAPDGKAATEGGSQAEAAHKGRPRGRARPRDKKQRRAHSVRLNPSELALIQSGADTAGMSVAGFLAYAGLAMARDQSRTAAAIATERDVLTELFAMRRQLGWAGSNLNQAAKILNCGGDVPHLTQVMADIHRAADAVRMAAEKVTNRQAGKAP